MCAQRDGFGIVWDLSVSDNEGDGRKVTSTVELDVAGARDPSASLENHRGPGTTVRSPGSFGPRFGTAIDDLSITTCVVVRFLPDRCSTRSAAVPQLAGQASVAQAARLEELVFDLPLDESVAAWHDGDRSGIDRGFDWESDGCSAGPLATLFEEQLERACLRHDLA